MKLIERLIERDILVDPDAFSTLSDDQKKSLDAKLDDLTDDEVEQFLDRGSVEILRSYTKTPQKRSFQDFVGRRPPV